jgi:hypothetical protein
VKRIPAQVWILIGYLVGTAVLALTIHAMAEPDRQWQCPNCYRVSWLSMGRYPSQQPLPHPEYARSNIRGDIVRHEYELEHLKELEGKLK